jgi:hypothetical protein
METFDMSDLRFLHLYLGVECICTGKGVFLTQRAYATSILEEYGMADCNPSSTPLLEGLKLGMEEDAEPTNTNHYQRLIYLNNTRPEVMYATGLLSRYMQHPKKPYLKAAMQVLRYIKGTINYGIVYNEGMDTSVIGYTSADWGNDRDDWKSISRYVFLLAGGTISWMSKKQSRVVLSSTDAKTKAICSGIKEAKWQKILQEKVENKELDPITIYCDDTNSIRLAKNPVLHSRNKHLEIYHHYIRENVLTGIVDLFYISTQDQIADILTKPLGRGKFLKFREGLGIRSSTEIKDLI